MLDKDDISHIASIYLIFENVDGINVPYKYIDNFHLSGIRDNYVRYANGIDKYKSAEEFYIEINKEFNMTEHASLYAKEHMDYNEIQLPFDRIIKHPDITHVLFHYEDGSDSEEIAVPWGNEEYTNTKQMYKLMDNGDLHICISEKHTIKDFTR